MTKTIETMIKYCPSCKNLSIFKYRGEQKGAFDGVRQLYDCEVCKSTLSYNHIIYFDNKKRLEGTRRLK